MKKEVRGFTKDSEYGVFNEELNYIREKYESKLLNIMEGYINDCIEENIEVSSADGMMYCLISQAITYARAKVTDEKKKK